MGVRPLLLVGDAPNLSNGLGRIARDLATVLHSEAEELGIRVAQLGWGYDGSPWPWRCYPVTSDWGKDDVLQVLRWHQGDGDGPGSDQAPVVFTVWDPSRCYPITEVLKEQREPVELWGYFPIDSCNRLGAIGGPARDALQRYARVLGYGRFGARVLEKTLDRGGEVPWLPHGLDPAWRAQAERVQHHGRVQAFLNQAKEGDLLLGVVAANQPRKDFGLFFETATAIRSEWEERGARRTVRLWVHTDRTVGQSDLGWSLQELASVYGWNNPRMLVTTAASGVSDKQLADLYSRCHCTLGIGLGEGFGYPLVESLGCGTPVIHGDFAGGPELVSDARWLVRPQTTRVEGPYALQRPVFSPDDWATRVLEAAEWKLEDPEACAAYCAGSVAHLRWENLRQHWLSLFREWLRGRA